MPFFSCIFYLFHVSLNAKNHPCFELLKGHFIFLLCCLDVSCFITWIIIFWYENRHLGKKENLNFILFELLKGYILHIVLSRRLVFITWIIGFLYKNRQGKKENLNFLLFIKQPWIKIMSHKIMVIKFTWIWK